VTKDIAFAVQNHNKEVTAFNWVTVDLFRRGQESTYTMAVNHASSPRPHTIAYFLRTVRVSKQTRSWKKRPVRTVRSRLWEVLEATDLFLLFDDDASILVLAQANKLRMSQMIDLRFILHLFVA
jgi:hypothetical protein